MRMIYRRREIGLRWNKIQGNIFPKLELNDIEARIINWREVSRFRSFFVRNFNLYSQFWNWNVRSNLKLTISKYSKSTEETHERRNESLRKLVEILEIFERLLLLPLPHPRHPKTACVSMQKFSQTFETIPQHPGQQPSRVPGAACLNAAPNYQIN